MLYIQNCSYYARRNYAMHISIHTVEKEIMLCIKDLILCKRNYAVLTIADTIAREI